MIIVLTGPNTYLASQTIHKLIDEFVRKNGKEGLQRLDGTQIEVAGLSDLFQGGLLFSTKRLIVFQELSQNKEVWTRLPDLLPAVDSDTTMVFQDVSPDKRTKTYRYLQKTAKMFEHNLLSERDLITWIEERVRARGAVISRQVSAYLLERVGLDQWRLHNEIEKLTAAQSDITRELIEELVEPTPQDMIFALLDTALTGQKDKLSFFLDEMSRNEDPYKLFGLLVSQITSLVTVASAPSSLSSTQVSQETGIHPFVVRKAQEQAKIFATKNEAAVIELLAETDVRLKTNSILQPWQVIRYALERIATL